MPTTEAGHEPNRCYFDQDGNLHLNGANLYSDESGTTLAPGELSVLDVTAGTVTASKAVVVDANKDASAFRNVTVTNLDAGASGTAGTVDVFPSTASKGKLAITAADSAGDTTTTIVNASQAGARTYTIPDAGASASFVMTVGAQSLTGNLTLASGADLIFSGTTGQSEITFTDNLADALSVKITGGADFLVFDSTDTNEKLTVLSAVTQKLGFWGKTPVVQPAAAAQAALTDSTGGADDGTLEAVGNTMMGDVSGAINNNFSELHTLLHAIRTALVDLGIIKGAA